MSVIKEIYNGNLRPTERYMQNNCKMSVLCDQIDTNINKVCDNLCKEKKELIKLIEEQNTELLCISDEESFIQGFRLGVKLMCDVFYGKSENFKSNTY